MAVENMHSHSLSDLLHFPPAELFPPHKMIAHLYMWYEPTGNGRYRWLKENRLLKENRWLKENRLLKVPTGSHISAFKGIKGSFVKKSLQ